MNREYVLHGVVLCAFIIWTAWYFYKCAWCRDREMFLAQAREIDAENSPSEISKMSKEIPTASLKELELADEELESKLAQHLNNTVVNIGAMDLERLKNKLNEVLNTKPFMIPKDREPLSVIKIEYHGSQVNGEHKIDTLLYRKGRSYGKHVRITLSNGGSTIMSAKVQGVIWRDAWELKKGADVFNKYRDSSWFAEPV
jgi:hypothetical protein